MAATKPTVLFILGAYYTPKSLAPFADSLKAQGYPFVCPALPTCGDTHRPATATSQDDAAVIREAALALIHEGKQILVVAHSYGGMVANIAMTADLFAKEPTQPGIIHLTYLAAGLALPGESMADLLQIFGWRSAFDLDTTSDGIATLKNPLEALWGDSDPSEVQHLAPLLTTFNFQHGTIAKATVAPWLEIPSVYIVCTLDKAIFPDFAEGMAKRAQDYGGKLSVMKLEAAHSAFETRPRDLLASLQEAWQRAQ